MAAVNSTLKRTFYVSYSYMKDRQQHLGASDVTTIGKLTNSTMIEMQRVLADKVHVPQRDLIITFFAELEG